MLKIRFICCHPLCHLPRCQQLRFCQFNNNSNSSSSSTPSPHRETNNQLFMHKWFKVPTEVWPSRSNKQNCQNYGVKNKRTPFGPRNSSNRWTAWWLQTTCIWQLWSCAQRICQHLAGFPDHSKEDFWGTRTLDNHPAFLQGGILHRIRWQTHPRWIGSHGHSFIWKHLWLFWSIEQCQQHHPRHLQELHDHAGGTSTR